MFIVDPSGKDDVKDGKRRGRLGGSMAYSTNALNALSTTGTVDIRLNANHVKGQYVRV